LRIRAYRSQVGTARQRLHVEAIEAFADNAELDEEIQYAVHGAIHASTKLRSPAGIAIGSRFSAGASGQCQFSHWLAFTALSHDFDAAYLDDRLNICVIHHIALKERRMRIERCRKVFN